MKTKKINIYSVTAKNKTCHFIPNFKVFFLGIIILAFTNGCKKFVDVPPPATQIAGATVFQNNTTAEAAITDIYIQMSSSTFDGVSNLNGITGLSSDELKYYGSSNVTLAKYYTNSLTANLNPPYWSKLYSYIYECNACIEGLTNSTTLTYALKQEMLGEAKFLRAFSHFYLVNLFGDIPLVTSTNYLTNNALGRTQTVEIYQQIIQDLKDAQILLQEDYLSNTGLSTTERIRVNKAAATALLARVYLYIGDWKNAQAQSSNVLANTRYTLLSDLTQVFLANSSEAIWQLRPSDQTFTNPRSGVDFVLLTAPGTSQNPVALSNNLINMFEVGDKRFTSWVGSIISAGNTYYYANKYTISKTRQPTKYYFMSLRLSEQYLIRAEAEAHLGNLTDAAADLDMIRMRAGLLHTTAVTQNDLLLAIQRERQVELFTEFGHRWFDLKRTGLINSVMGPPGNVCIQKGGSWSANWALYPIPRGEIDVNPKLTQNTGY